MPLNSLESSLRSQLTGSVTEFDAYTLLRAYNYSSERLYNDLNLYQSDNTIADAGQVLYASEYRLPRYSKRAPFNGVVSAGEDIDNVLSTFETILDGARLSVCR